jgi:hypothetical protein
MTASERVRVLPEMNLPTAGRAAHKRSVGPENRRHAAMGRRAQRSYGICFTGSAEHFP